MALNLIKELLESLSFTVPIKWVSHSDREVGSFSLEENKYQIFIEYKDADVALASSDRKFSDIIEVSFGRLIDDQLITTKIPSDVSSGKVFGAVFNGILEKIDWDSTEMVIFSAKKVGGDSLEDFTKRSHLYETMARRVHRRTAFGYIQEKIQNAEGDHFILVNQKCKLSTSEIKDLVQQNFK